MDSAFPVMGDISFDLILKIAVLFVIFLYFLFTFLAFIQVRALNRMVKISRSGESIITQTLFFIYLLLVASLFVIALVIL